MANPQQPNENFNNVPAGDTPQPRVTDKLRIPGWEAAYHEQPLHWLQNQTWQNANYILVTGYLIRHEGNVIREKPIPVFIDSVVYNPHCAHLVNTPNLYNTNFVNIRNHNGVAGTEFLEFANLRSAHYDLQYAQVPLTRPGNAASYFIVIHPLQRTINVDRFVMFQSELVKSAAEAVLNKVTWGNASNLIEVWKSAGSRPLQRFNANQFP
ncbi:uncharacterized protein I303_106980 [Kwoniella dejecticola CBS 10117]|uniref:Uncharacterized protein n=1 Tax=Kwoniella dejecticola CBS 10117 TaxID=1296121 RepID=A0A1A5ZYD3_9TREE|nr:uncharacterized protein I303_06381 [Kwoniella dejecticola CBS 10117]OBR82824.1 hypothetical protein I303_06381 [Kwoniella dejecticola CBS 10117]